MGINANVFQAWGQSQGEGVIVAVLDTGIDITHEDLQENIWVNKGEIPDNGIDDDLNGCVDDIYGWDFCHNTNQVHHPQLVYDEWHGTHIAGIIAGVAGNGKGIAGVAPKAEIMPLKVFAQGISYTSDVINAIEYAKKMGAQIANCSWETNKENPALRDVMESSPMFFVCAAGNSHSCIDENPVYPAYFPAKNIITVASINEIGNLSGFSNYGEKQVDVAAPGEEIMSTLPENNYARSSGTSQAAAFVSGEAALLLSQNFDIKAEDLGTLITGSSDRLTSLFDKVKGGYKINCENGVSGAGPNPVIVVEVPTVKKEEGNNFNINSNPIVLSEENQWMAKADMPTARSGFGTAVLEGKIYAIGGQSRTTIYDIVEVLDPENNTWASKESMPKSRRYLGTAALNGKVYAIGGLNSSGAFLNSVEEYDPETDNWTSKTGMFTSRAHLGAASCNGKIYALGGYNNASGMVNTVEEYDPETNSWTQKASMPIAVRLFGVAVEEGSIYVIGGLYDTEPGPWVQQYQPDTNVWSYKAAMPTFRGRLAAASAGGKIYALGGELISGNTAIVEEYDPVSNTWKRKPSLLQARCELGGAAVDGSLYAIGGMESFWYYYDDVEEYTPDVSQQFHYTYDENNRLERVELPSGEVIEFEYDANGNLIRKSQ
ncbi:MAG: S8 family serine peptidase, partial [Syntrophomonadaceae bacterium]|nr:S8 family serine peptidase [Syntrophomonadaceae bacterium]